MPLSYKIRFRFWSRRQPRRGSMSPRISQALHVTRSLSCLQLWSQRTASAAVTWCLSICQAPNWEAETLIAPFYVHRQWNHLLLQLWSSRIKQFQENRFNTSISMSCSKLLSLGVPHTHNAIITHNIKINTKYMFSEESLSKNFFF
jgi:hypothetical protein